MKLSVEQHDALHEVSDWLVTRHQPVFRLFGYAGTGKTTIANKCAENVNGHVQFASFTGKAAQVMRTKGCANARTIHSLIYKPVSGDANEDADRLHERLDELVRTNASPAIIKTIRQQLNALTQGHDEKPSFTLNSTSDLFENKTRLIVIDECSMVGERIAEDLESFGIPILVLGDPGQLPPVADAGYYTNAEPDVMLNEIHRQAAENPILRLATLAREGRPIPYGVYGTTKVIRRRDMAREDVYMADQLLVGLNRTRRDYNKRYRTGIFKDENPMPRQSDRLICLRNDAKKSLLNGSQWVVKEIDDGQNLDHSIEFEIDSVDGMGAQCVIAHPDPFLGRDITLPWKTRQKAQEFDYGYAITVHKSQGSQWDRVVLFDEGSVFREKEANWLYTGITRAAECLTIVRD